MKLFHKVFFSVFFLVSVASFGAEGDVNSDVLKVGDTAPCILLDGLDKDHNPKRECMTKPTSAEDKFVIIDFFSIYCAPCLDNLKLLAPHEEEVSKVATFRLVTSDEKEEVLDFLEDHAIGKKINHPISFDPEFVAADRFGVEIFPTMFILDNKGKILYAHEGELVVDGDRDDVQEILDVLAGKPVVSVDEGAPACGCESGCQCDSGCKCGSDCQCTPEKNCGDDGCKVNKDKKNCKDGQCDVKKPCCCDHKGCSSGQCPKKENH